MDGMCKETVKVLNMYQILEKGIQFFDKPYFFQKTAKPVLLTNIIQRNFCVLMYLFWYSVVMKNIKHVLIYIKI